MSVIKPTRSKEERKPERRATAVIRCSPFSMREIQAEPELEETGDPYDLVNWKSGDVISAERLNQTDEGVDKNADAIKELKARQPKNIPTSLIDNLF